MGPGWARRTGLQGAADAAGRELGVQGRGPGCSPVVPSSPRDFRQTWLLRASPGAAVGERRGAAKGLSEACVWGQSSAPGPPPDRRGAAAPDPLPGASRGSMRFFFAVLGEVAGRKIKELCPHFSLLCPPGQVWKTTLRISKKQSQNCPQAPFKQIPPFFLPHHVRNLTVITKA